MRQRPGPKPKAIILADVKPSNPRRTKLAKFGTNATFWDLAEAEPRLREILTEVRSIHGADFETCPENLWFCWADARKGIKARVLKLTGRDVPADWIAVDYLYRQLKLCLHCLDRAPLEADLEADFFDRIISAGFQAQRQVTTRFGRADIVTDNYVFEIKLDLTRVAIFQAIGQATAYAHALGKPRIGIGGRATAETGRLLPALKELGIKVELWNYPARTLDFQEIV
jgi:hypothetical protein